jgi:hypothetical protein
LNEAALTWLRQRGALSIRVGERERERHQEDLVAEIIADVHNQAHIWL